MKKPIIDAKEALEDIRSGLDDSVLMKKYNLSLKGLRSLCRKLADAGFLKYLDAKDVVKDILSGMEGGLVQEKYGLSSKGLENLFKELERTGLIWLTDEQRRTSPRITINSHEISADIRSGMTSSALMIKYGLTSRGFQWVCLRLVADGCLSADEIYEELFSSDGSLSIETVRAHERYQVKIDTSVFELMRPESRGKVIDVSVGGLRVLGMGAEAGEIKTLVIPKDLHGEFGQVVFDARCRWAKSGDDGACLAGFEIIHMSPGMMEEYKLFIQSRTTQK